MAAENNYEDSAGEIYFRICRHGDFSNEEIDRLRHWRGIEEDPCLELCEGGGCKLDGKHCHVSYYRLTKIVAPPPAEEVKA